MSAAAVIGTVTIPQPPCVCHDCVRIRRGPETIAGVHEFAVEEAPGELPALYGAIRWRWRCVCRPRAIGHWTYQSPAAAYHGWRDHVRRQTPVEA